MPVSAKMTTTMQGNSRVATAKMIRQILIDARGTYYIWGQMLRGPTPIESLTEDDLDGLIKTVERYRGEYQQ